MEEKKWPKPAALYIEKPNTDYKCIDCHFWMNKRCALYGKNIPIEEYGTCGLWVEKNGEGDKDFIGSVTKAETGYEEHKDGFSCKRCEYFDGKSSCEKVEGMISPNGCCNRWESEDEEDEPKPKIKLRIKK